MLLKFTLSNYRSFKDDATLDLEACSIKEQSDNVFLGKSGSHTYQFLKSIVILGANSSGKSNLFKGFALMRHIILNSVSETSHTKKYKIEPHLLSTETENKPALFECVLMIDGVVYRYGFKANNSEILSEWLYRAVKRREEAIFTREKNKFEILKSLATDLKKRLTLLIDTTRNDALYLTVMAQFNVDFALKISDWFATNTVYSDLDLSEAINYTRLLLVNKQYKALFNEILDKSDLGFSEIEALKKTQRVQFFSMADGPAADQEEHEIKVVHTKYNAGNEAVKRVSLDLMNNESSGSQKLVALLGPIINALIQGSILWIDEFDAQIHPYIVSMVMGLFNSVKHNPKGAQLIVISYNQQILKKLRRDQIVFLNKTPFGASTVSALYLFNPHVRSNATFDKEYLEGLYGGVPQINKKRFFEAQSISN